MTHQWVVTWVLKNRIMLRNFFFPLFLFAGLPCKAVLVYYTRASFWSRGWIGTEIQTSLCWISCVLWCGTVAAQRKGCLFFIQPKCPLGWWWLCFIPSTSPFYNWLFRVSESWIHADPHVHVNPCWFSWSGLFQPFRVGSTCYLGFFPKHTYCPCSVG